MNGWLVINGFLKMEKFQEIYQWLYKACKDKQIDIEMKTNEELLVECRKDNTFLEEQKKKVDFILFWDKDIRLAKRLEQLGYYVINSAKAIESCDDKGLTHEILAMYGIPMPKTILAPMTYANIGYTNLDFIEKVIEKLGLPLILKENFGSFGAQVYLCKTRTEVEEKTKELEGKAILYQEFVKEANGRDLRLQVVGNEVVAAMERTAREGDFRANITNGGTMKAYQPTKEEITLAIKVCQCLEVDFAGVDLLFGKEGKMLVCEVNSNAHFKNIYDCTKVNVAEYIVAYILKKIKGE